MKQKIQQISSGQTRKVSRERNNTERNKSSGNPWKKMNGSRIERRKEENPLENGGGGEREVKRNSATPS